ncbi:unnamed protein product [Rhizoctonia solani]|uniref:Laminin domain protein n=1 Tax=Rhizoctonia solani TaxID=456999 RepID=A0A8H2Y0B8_9AGAM|nr:unnamed protein product [Rhizoctonia solani]
MADHPGWYPPGQVCYPPELPMYLKNIYDLKPVVGTPNDAEVMGIHSVMHSARKASDIPGMLDSGLLVNLADHLFNVQMARYRSRYSLITFPSDATYTPPVLPTHVSVTLGPVSGAPSDDEMTKVQDSIRSYQRFDSVPSMFDPRVNMELSQHLFDLQMARHMRLAGENQPRSVSENNVKPSSPIQITEQKEVPTEEAPNATNNAGKGASVLEVDVPHSTPVTNIHEPTEQSNQLAERFSQVLERLIQVVERTHEPARQSDQLVEHLSQVIERFNLLTEQSNQFARPSTIQSNPLEEPNQPPEPALSSQKPSSPIEQFNQLLGRFNELLSQVIQPLKRSNELAERANAFAEQLNWLTERSNELTEESKKPVERFEGLMKNINKVLVGIQHAIVRNRRDNKVSALDCLVNEKGETPSSSKTTYRKGYDWLSKYESSRPNLPVMIGSVSQEIYVPEGWLAEFVCFYGIWQGVCESETSTELMDGKGKEARERLSRYLSSCLG